MDLSTTYLGLELRNPLIVSPSPLNENLDNLKRMENAGAGAIVLHSLFEEQIQLDSFAQQPAKEQDLLAGELPFTTDFDGYRMNPRQYIEHIRQAKAELHIPIIASLNATSPGEWTRFAAQLEQAGADAIELNIYIVAANPSHTGTKIEKRYLDIVKKVRAQVKVPIAVKVGPFFSSMSNMARRFKTAGARGLTLFNRFYQPDVFLGPGETMPRAQLSTPAATRLPMRWIALLYGKIPIDFAATSGVHSAPDVAKLLMAGASATMLCSVLLKRGIDHIHTVRVGLERWMNNRGYASVQEMIGSMSQKYCYSPSKFERDQYIRALKSFQISNYGQKF